MKAYARPIVALLFFAVLAPTPAVAQESAPRAALDDLGRLVGGEWHAEGSPYYHVFEWGVGRHTIIARTYTEADGELSSEARWFWHPGEKVLRGYSIDATGTFFAEMTTRFDGDRMVNELETIGPDGSVARFVGEWSFPDPDTYDWVLFERTDGGRERQMGLTFRRADR